MKQTIMLLALIFLSAISFANDAANIRFVAQGGLTVGGDELGEAEVDYLFGGSDDESVDAGSGLLFTAGVLVAFREKPIDLQLTAGFHFDGIAGSDDNDEISFTRGILEALTYYRKGNHRFGGGLSYHANPDFDNDVDDINFQIEFDNALGVIVEYRYVFDDTAAIGFRMVEIDYQWDGPKTIDGSHVGLTFSFFI